MDYKPYKTSARKVALWMGSVMAGALAIGLILFFCLKFTDLKARAGFAIEYAFDLIFIFILFFCFTMNRILYRILLQPQKITYEDDSEEYQFGLNWFTHFLIIFISVIIFFLVISCHSAGLHISWTKAALDTIYVNVILFIYNLIFMYLYILILQYLLNNNEAFKNEIVNLEKEVKSKEEQ